MRRTRLQLALPCYLKTRPASPMAQLRLQGRRAQLQQASPACGADVVGALRRSLRRLPRGSRQRTQQSPGPQPGRAPATRPPRPQAPQDDKTKAGLPCVAFLTLGLATHFT